MNSILLPLDGSPLAEQSIPYAASLARRSGAQVILVRAAQAHTLLDVDAGTAQIAVMQRAEQDLEAVATRLRSEGVNAEVHVYYGQPLPAILDAAGRHKVGLIVMATHGRSGLGRMMYGSVADDVLRHADVPVLLVPATLDHAWPLDRPLTILVPLDGSALAEDALSSAELLADLPGARLHLLRVVEPPRYPLYGDGYAYLPFDDAAELQAARAYLDELAGRLSDAGRQVSIEVAVGLPSAVVPRVANESQADLIAMATHGRGGLARLVLGSVATGTLQRTHVPLLLTRPAALDRPLPVPRSEVPETTGPPAIALSLTTSELGLVRQAVESLLLTSSREEHVSAPLRSILDRVRAAQQDATPAEREVVGATSRLDDHR